MTDEEIKQAINEAIGSAFEGVKEQFEKIDHTKKTEPTGEDNPPEPIEPLQTRINNAVKSFVEDKKAARKDGKDLEYKPNNTLTGKGKDV